MADNSSILAALRGINPADAMPFGAGTTPEGSPTALSGILSGIMNIPQHAIEGATEDVQHYQQQGMLPNDPSRAVGPATDAAMMMTGGAGVVPAEANSLRMGIKAYHASPHDFNAFDLSKMGTGEGKADFGKGIYAAENPHVGKYYNNQFGPNSNMYHLDINAEPHQFLDWDKPVTTDLIKQAITNPNDAKGILDYLKEKNKAGKDLTGQDLYTSIAKLTSPDYANSVLSKAGIPGLKYLDAGSRMKGEGTSNYVVFDPSLINILKKEKGFNPGEAAPSSAGDVFRQDALQTRNDFYHKDVQPLQRQYMENLLTPDERRIARGYTTPAFKGGVAHFDKPMNPDFADWSKQDHGTVDNFYSTSDPKLAELYAGKWKDISKSGNLYSSDQDLYGNGANISPLWLNTKDYHVVDARGQNILNLMQASKDTGLKLGAPGVTVKNTWDEPSFTKTLPNPQDVHITFPQGLGTVKSRFAKEFDPNSTNMLKGIGAVGTGTTAEMVNALRDKKEKKQ
jgi:hypothetical protein